MPFHAAACLAVRMLTVILQPAGATPHHLALLADPQLVDPHTYPGRPWPLDKATILHTDQYLRRTYDTLQQDLDPDSVMFLGDLFDGGREWSTSVSDNPDKQWKGWGEEFWLKEYDRWGKIFLRNNGQAGRAGDHPRGDRKIIASLPGNHDLGISSGVRVDVRNRFSAFFGEGNRVDIIGNHSIVSVDSVSMTAKAIASAEDREKNREIWEPTSKFLDTVQKKKAQALERHLNGKTKKPENPRFDHSVIGITDPEVKSIKSTAGEGLHAEVPTILLTHVPLFRAAGTPCGPLREKYPPTKGLSDADGPVTDDRNALSLHAGYQYQNVLDPEISKELIEKIGNVAHVFSGDDHDYCEVVHRGYTSPGGGVREITVKSMSWAMGVRKPGFVLVSLWNPIDESGMPLPANAADGPTIQTKLCLLPDALGTFIGYGRMFLLTFVTLLVSAFIGSSSGRRVSSSKLGLPLYERESNGWRDLRRGQDLSSSSASSNMSDSSTTGLLSRSMTQRGKAQGGSDGWAMPVNRDSESETEKPASASYASAKTRQSGPLSAQILPRWQMMLHEFAVDLAQVGLAGFSFYFWLAYTF